jgi:cobaltochelatase CobS
MQSLTAMLTAKQTGAMLNALVMLGAPAPQGGQVTDAWLRSLAPDLVTRAAALCGPRTLTLATMFTQGAPAATAAAPTPAPGDAPALPSPAPAVAAAPVAHPEDLPPAAPAAATTSTAGALFGVAGDAGAIPVKILPGGRKHDPAYVFRADLIAPLLHAWGAGLHAWLYGPPGTGKTTMLREIAARTGRPFFRVNFADGVDRGDLIGQDTLTAGSITFRAGAVLTALRTPHAILLLDEPSVARPEDLIALHPILDGSGAAIIPQTGQRIEVAEGVSIAVANNNRGDADRSGMYAGLRPQSEALRDRFGVFIEVPHLTVAQEGRLLRKRIPSMDKATAVALATTLQASRELARKEDFPQAAISHRQALAWASLMGAGMTPQAAFTAAVSARHDPEMGEALQALYLKNFAPGDVTPEAAKAIEEGDE